MKVVYGIIALCVAIGLTGCEKISKPYIMTVEREDQKVAGNRGYIEGTPPAAEDNTGRKRSLVAVDMDLVSIQGKPVQETKIVTKEGPKAVFPNAFKRFEDKDESNIK